nr:MAG TPA: hypothetical protein [Caudoviricetes sp.]
MQLRYVFINACKRGTRPFLFKTRQRLMSGRNRP